MVFEKNVCSYLGAIVAKIFNKYKGVSLQKDFMKPESVFLARTSMEIEGLNATSSNIT